jgi:5-methylthioadenosine/S-adenosylhomocysteine deaminase
VVTCDGAGTVHRPGVVDVEAGRIAWVGPAGAAPVREGNATERFDGVLLPGLVNVHCHSPMTLFRGAAEDVPLDRFLREILWPREARLTAEDVYWGMTLAAAELLRAGVTTTCEMYVFEEAILQAVLDAGSRCVLTPGVMEAPGWLSWRERLRETLAFVDQHVGRHERVRLGIAPHSAYALPADGLDAVAAAARDRGLLVHVHVAETRTEGAELEHAHGKSVPAILDEHGLLGPRTLAAHSVWLSDDDLELYRQRGVAVAHCPQSNAKLAAGTARLAEMLARGLRVGLGTDGPSSNNDLDLWEELRLAPLLARLQTGLADAVPAATALRLATAGGAAAVGWDEIGVLEPGRFADVVHVRTDDPAFVPSLHARDIVSHLVWSASSRLVEDVWVGGARVVRGGRCITVDVHRAAAEVQARAERLAAASVPGS